jgi:cob(I)alamin adenosyltransferase
MVVAKAKEAAKEVKRAVVKRKERKVAAAMVTKDRHVYSKYLEILTDVKSIDVRDLLFFSTRF